MNDFSDIESELRKLRPATPSPGMMDRISRDLETPAPDNIIEPARFRFGWIAIGCGLAAAAAFMMLARVNLPTSEKNGGTVAATSPGTVPTGQLASAQYIPAGASRVVYNTRDEGLLFPRGSSSPVRRVRSRSRETWQWQNPETGASLRVSYPSEEVRLIPVSGQ